MPTDNATSRKQASHGRILDAAARSMRRNGYAGVGVADVMREAGLTHGGFYAHFASRDALLVEAMAHARRHSGVQVGRSAEALQARGASPLRALVESYLSDRMLESSEVGCPVAALCSEMPRQPPAVRKASSASVRGLIGLVERSLPASVPSARAGVIAATLVGSLQLARAVGSVAQGKALLASARAALLEQYDLPPGRSGEPR